MVVLALSAVYGVLAVALMVRRRAELVRTVEDGLVTPYDRLEEADRVAASQRSGVGDSVDPS